MIGAMLYGGAELLDMDARLVALEGLHPEMTTGVSMDPHAVEEPAQEPSEEPESATEPAEEPAEAEAGTVEG